MIKKGNVGAFNPREEGWEPRSSSVAKATRKCQGHIQPTELKRWGKREEYHVYLLHLLCMFRPTATWFFI